MNLSTLFNQLLKISKKGILKVTIYPDYIEMDPGTGNPIKNTNQFTIKLVWGKLAGLKAINIPADQIAFFELILKATEPGVYFVKIGKKDNKIFGVIIDSKNL